MSANPGSFQTTITDHQGHSYELAADIDETGLNFMVIDRRFLISAIVGTVRSFFQAPGVLILGDIEIFEPPLFIPRGVLGWLWLSISRKRLPATHRRRGLGTVMLRTLLTLAAENGIHTVSGYVVSQDVAANPGLLDWYHRHGFEVRPCEGKSPVPDCVARIDLDMRNAEVATLEARLTAG